MSETDCIEQIIRANIGTQKVKSIRNVSGGCISSARQVILSSGECFLVKLNRIGFVKNFEAEHIGLSVLRQTDSVNVPESISFGILNSNSYLIMEWIETEIPQKGFSTRLGEALASLHSVVAESRFGFSADNFIGSTPQANDWTPSWPDFFVENRLRFQLNLASQNQFTFDRFDLEKTLPRIRRQLNENHSPCLIHGDLWSGNYVVGPGNRPYLIDPAPYWADREAEFGILTMFGGFNEEFFAAYERLLPFEDGFRQRLPIYQLYHYLNHLNLFGGSYLSQCNRILSLFG